MRANQTGRGALSAILCEADFALLMGAPLSSQYAQVYAVKVVYDLKKHKSGIIGGYFTLNTQKQDDWACLGSKEFKNNDR